MLEVITGDTGVLIREYASTLSSEMPIYEFPESGRSSREVLVILDELFNGLKAGNHAIVLTNSLFVLREVQMRSEGLDSIAAKWVNVRADGVETSDSVDGIGPLDCLDQELTQSDRYLNMNAWG